MRLVCPKCSAQYEVDINAIPEDGRDVQCANCGNTWFQGRDTPQARPDPIISYDTETRADPADEPVTEPVPDTRPQATPVDQSVLDILRQEAEHDAATRDTASVTEPTDEPTEEPQPEPEQNLAQRARDVRNRTLAVPGQERRLHLSTGDEGTQPPNVPDEPDQPDEELGVAPAPRRPRQAQTPQRDLPDVDELNSTLRSAKDKSRGTEKNAASAKGQSRGSSLGFYAAILIFLILLAAYALKPQIVSALPDAAPYLDQYTDLVDVIRHRLADGVVALIEAARNLIAQFL